MNNSRCLYCYQLLQDEIHEYHTTCRKKILGDKIPTVLSFRDEDIINITLQNISAKSTLTGAQPKLSVSANDTDSPNRLTLFVPGNEYILKPQSIEYPEMPELEDLTMHLADASKIKTVPHTLIRTQSGTLAYLTRRIDRNKNGKLHMEDMCQLTEKMTEEKYKGSYEQIAKVILKYSANPRLDLIDFFEVVLFSFITGNSDMHLKNFSLIKMPNVGYMLSPAYDLIPSKLLIKQDPEELALTLAGKKRKLRREHFETTMVSFGINKKSVNTIFGKLYSRMEVWRKIIDQSFASSIIKEEYWQYITIAWNQLGMT